MTLIDASSQKMSRHQVVFHHRVFIMVREALLLPVKKTNRTTDIHFSELLDYYCRCCLLSDILRWCNDVEGNSSTLSCLHLKRFIGKKYSIITDIWFCQWEPSPIWTLTKACPYLPYIGLFAYVKQQNIEYCFQKPKVKSHLFWLIFPLTKQPIWPEEVTNNLFKDP